MGGLLMPRVHDPKPEVVRIEELARKVKEGDIKLPKFQRPFVWHEEDILNLLDSVYHGYPIGSVLLWRTKQRLTSQRTIGDLAVDERPEEYPTNYLLDGQQRISTLCGVLFWNGKDNKSKWNVAFDLRNEQFFIPKPTEELKAHEFPLNKLLGTFDFLNQAKRLEACHDRDDLVEVAGQLLSSIKDYKIAAVVLGDMSLDEVAPIFERINSTGRRLTIVDLMRAATWKGDFDLSDGIDDVRTGLVAKHFGDVPEKNVLRNIAGAAAMGINNDDMDRLRDYSSEQLKGFTSSVATAYKLAVDFLNTELTVRSYSFLPYGLQLTFLVEFFRICPSPSIIQRRILKQWFWKTAISGHYQGANTTKMGQDLSSMRSFAEGRTSDLPVDTPLNVTKFMESNFSLRNASSKAFALMLAAAKPLSLFDGAPIDASKALAVANRLEFHHIFPREFVKPFGYSSEQINRFANICMLNLDGNRAISDTRPSKYLTTVADQLGADLSTVLRSNLISRHAWEAAINEDYEEFLRIRTDDLALAAAELAGVDDLT